MKRNIRLFLAIFKISMNHFTTYRLDAVFNFVFTSGIWALLNVTSMYVIAIKAKTIFGWSTGELILLSCIYNVFIGVFGFLFARGFNEFSEIVDTGKLDLFLLKPLDAQLYLSIHTLGVNYLVRTLIGVILAMVTISTFQLNVTWIGVPLFVVTSFIGVFLLYSMLFGLNIFVMWAPRLDNINELFYSLRSLGRYPRDSFRQLGEVGFVLLSPFVIILATPAKMLLGTASVYDFLELLIAAVVMFTITRLFWKFALRYYTSASS